MKILRIEEGGYAAEMGLKAGDNVKSISGHPIRDIIDFEFWAYDDECIMTIQRDDKTFDIECPGGVRPPFGAEFEPMTYRCCGNNCIFCFVDQNPAGLRRSLYFKDEDIRLSFLYGNYVTLTNVSQKQLNRIIEQRLSPLYISVHAIDPDVRRKMLGIKADDRLLEKLGFLADHGIQLHTQIVLCPQINDGAVLEQTIETLASFYPAIASVAIVPVGLTQHRQELPFIAPVTAGYATLLLQWYEIRWPQFKHRFGFPFIYLADEFYLQAGSTLPPSRFYGQFDQIENGVGLTRAFLDEVKRQRHAFPDSIPETRVALVTGRLAAPVLQKKIIPMLRQVKGLTIRVKTIDNRFFGSQVTVSGLLTGQDIAHQSADLTDIDQLWLPPNSLNMDGRFLDDWTVKDVQNHLGVKVAVPFDGFDDVLNEIEKKSHEG